MMRALPVLLLVAACADPLPSRSEVEGLRVLAIRADAPEIRPEQTTLLDALYADPFGQCVTVEGRKGPEPRLWPVWTACVDPPGDDPLRCLGREGSWTLAPAASTVLEIPEAIRPTGEATIGVALHLCCGAGVLAQAIPPVCQGQMAVAVRHVAVSLDPENENPEIATLSFGGVEIPRESEGIAIPQCPDGCPEYRVTVVPSDESTETIEDPPGTFGTEGLFAAFAADGDATFSRPFDDRGMLASDLQLPPFPDGESKRVWVVLHDDRGGVDYRVVRVQAR